MRPVNKGPDRGSYRPYGKACGPLQEAIGAYCSYCERWIASAIEVEHILPKKLNPAKKFRWINFLLACKNCNAGKQAANQPVRDQLWPDFDNTFIAFTYDSEGRVYPSNSLPPEILRKAQATWRVVNLNWHPDLYFPGMSNPSDKDFRYLHRKQAWKYASDKRDDLQKFDTPERREKVAVDALQRGMFSVWMAVFGGNSSMDRAVRCHLIEKFSGTDTTCFNRLGRACRSARGQI